MNKEITSNSLSKTFRHPREVLPPGFYGKPNSGEAMLWEPEGEKRHISLAEFLEIIGHEPVVGRYKPNPNYLTPDQALTTKAAVAIIGGIIGFIDSKISTPRRTTDVYSPLRGERVKNVSQLRKLYAKMNTTYKEILLDGKKIKKMTFKDGVKVYIGYLPDKNAYQVSVNGSNLSTTFRLFKNGLLRQEGRRSVGIPAQENFISFMEHCMELSFMHSS